MLPIKLFAPCNKYDFQVLTNSTVLSTIIYFLTNCTSVSRSKQIMLWSSGLIQNLYTLFQVFKRMLSPGIISAFIKWSYLIKPGLNRLNYFIVGALDGKESSQMKGY